MSSKNYLLAIDQGTTGTKALIVDQSLNIVAEAVEGFKQHYPQPSWVEHDANEIWETAVKTIQKVTQNIDPRQIAAIGITNQRETVCFWDKKTGEVLSSAIVWQDRRTSDFCQKLVKAKKETLIRKKTGLVIDPYFSGTKVRWALKNWDTVKAAQKKGRLAVGTIDSFLISRLSANRAHVTEPSNASRTLCFHLTEHVWDKELARLIEVPTSVWPEVLPSVGKFTTTQGVPGLPDGIPITGVLGDQQSALLGQACLKEGMAKCTYGTGAFLLLNTGKKPIQSKHRLLTTIAWALDSKNYTYALEGSAFIAGAAVQWARDGLKIVGSSAEIEDLALQVASSEGVTFVPALTGLGAPYWDPEATGMLTGITRGTTQAHIARAVLEGVAFQNADLLIAMQKDLGKPLKTLRVDGGASANQLLMQFQADILGVELERPEYRESTSLGAVFAAGLGAGIWTSLSEIEKVWKKDAEFKPKINKKQRIADIARWHNAIKRVLLKPQ